MTQLTTTLNELRKHESCADGWEKLLAALGKTKADDEPLPLAFILESNGLNNAVWALRAIDSCYDGPARLYACRCARLVLPLYENERLKRAMETAERYAKGEASKEELGIAVYAADVDRADDAVADAVADAVVYAAYAVRAARAAAYYAARAASYAAYAADAAAYVVEAAESTCAIYIVYIDIKSELEKEFLRLCALEGEYGELI